MKGKYLRIIVIPIIALIVVCAVFIYSYYHTFSNTIQQRELKRLNAIVLTLSEIIDGDIVELIHQTYPNKHDITIQDQDSNYLKIQKILYAAQKQNGLEKDLLLLTKRPNAKVPEKTFFHSVNSKQISPFSGDSLYYREYYDKPPKALFDKYAVGGMIEPYTTSSGNYITAFAPVENSRGDVVAIVEADLELSSFYAQASKELLGEILTISIIVILLLAVVGFLINYTIKAIVKYNNDMMSKGMKELESTQRTIEAFTSSIEAGDYEREIEMDKEESESDIINSLINMRSYLSKSQREDTERKWANEGLAKFAEILRNNNDNIDLLADDVINNLIIYVRANQGLLFVYEKDSAGDEKLVIKACYAYSRKKYLNTSIDINQGLAGQCYLEKETILLKEIPEEYVNITSGLGDAPPNNVLITPLKVNEDIYGVLEIASFDPFEEHVVKFVEKIAENIGATLSIVQSNSRTKRLLEESKMLTENLRSQEEEMRQNMEEMSATQEEMERGRKNLEKIQEKNRFIIDCMSEMMIISNKNGVIQELNAKFVNDSGYDTSIIKSRNMTDIIEGMDISDPNSFLWNVHQLKFKRKNGNRLDVNVFFGEIEDEQGNPMYVALITNLTDKIRTEQTIEEQKKALEEAHQTIATLQSK